MQNFFQVMHNFKAGRQKMPNHISKIYTVRYSQQPYFKNRTKNLQQKRTLYTISSRG